MGSSVRVTEADVEEIMGDQSFSLDPYIDTAHRIVEDSLSGEGLSEATLTEIEKYYTAHIATLRNPVVKREVIDDAEIEYMRTSGMGLLSTSFGQIVNQLDTTGILRQNSKNPAYFWAPDILTEDLT